MRPIFLRRSVMTRLLCLFCLTTSHAFAATQVHVSRDAEGNLVFSDRVSEGSEPHEVEELPTVPAFVAPSATSTSQTQTTAQAGQFYTHLKILSPGNQDNIPTGLAASLNIVIDALPALRASDTFVVLVDGKPVTSGRDNSLPINQLVRGQHTLEAVINNASGQEILRSQAVTVYIQRHSIQNPQLQQRH
ncbi:MULTISPECIES: hypothetical protein [unclassified Oceanobacter]|uniref:hypothetical protein n=1 Tax=unclassified Oceanobacter TaxID=2620260 RepID=UPI0026E45958|nr:MULTISPECIES: hypothetical protein [unclassified Oceanobacter]MDO6681856.1 hypothetical protein [Oceanobacter sp. 5_MG-2023]MDP2549359.1 hypothetical protein [Oceanobacter sp. 4_MG-2023]